MKINKKVISDLTLCYCVAPLTYHGKQHFLVASEKEFPCLLFDENGNQVDKIWDGPGGTMSAVQIPGTDGAFLATHKFYSPNNSKEAKIVLVQPGDDGWKVRTLLELPYVHRFDILTRDGCNYLLACCLKSDYEYKDDWRFPGKTYACRLPDNLLDLPEDAELTLTVLRDGMLKNHGYSRDVVDGVMTGVVTSEEGVFRFTPPAQGGETWQVEQLIGDPTSDAILVDLDGCGEKELLTIGPFHGENLAVYKKNNGAFEKVWQYEKQIPFAHAICKAQLGGREVAVVGHRKGERDLLMISREDGEYHVEILDHDVGPANVLYYHKDQDILLAANREINEVAYYTLEDILHGKI